MKKLLFLLSYAMWGGLCTQATLIQFDISPASGALNLGASVYTQDHAVALAAPNAVGQPASPATGNEVGGGITFDDVTNLLTYDIAYGSAFGFVDLAGDFTVAHIHGPVPVQFPSPNTGAGVTVGLSNIASGTRSGRFTGSVTLTSGQGQDLLDNELYINVHSGFAGGGEIRGQLVAVPEPSAFVLLGFGVVLLFQARRNR